MQFEKRHPSQLESYANSRQRISDARGTITKMPSTGDAHSKERAPWAFEMIDDFQERMCRGGDVTMHSHLEFRKIENMRDAKKIGDYAGGLLSVNVHMRIEPEISEGERDMWFAGMRDLIVRDSNGTVNRHTGVTKSYPRGISVEFKLWFGVEHAEHAQEAGAIDNSVYLGTPKKKEEIREFLELIEKAITLYNKAVSGHPKDTGAATTNTNGNLASLARS